MLSLPLVTPALAPPPLQLLYTAEMKLPTGMPLVEKKDHVSVMVEYLGLTECRKTRVGGQGKRGISGGQVRLSQD